MFTDIETLEERGGWMFICWSSTTFDKPERIKHYWPLKVRFTDFARRFNSDEEAKAILGQKVVHLGQGVFRDTIKFMTYRLVNGAQTQPEFTEREDVPPPKQRGKQFPLRWRDGYWQKETARGWVAA